MSEPQGMKLNFNQAVMMLQQERASLDAVRQRILQFRQTLEETLITKETLKAIEKTKQNESILIALGSGVYLDGNAAETQKVKVTLPGAVIQSVTIPEAMKALETRQAEAEQEIKRLSEDERKLATNVNSLLTVAQQIESQKK